jgi:hypothetical protein
MAETELGHAVRVEKLIRSPSARRKQRDWHMEPLRIDQNGVRAAKIVGRDVGARREVEIRGPNDSASRQHYSTLVFQHGPYRLEPGGFLRERPGADALLR